jgi:hypothetical protein
MLTLRDEPLSGSLDRAHTHRARPAPFRESFRFDPKAIPEILPATWAGPAPPDRVSRATCLPRWDSTNLVAMTNPGPCDRDRGPLTCHARVITQFSVIPQIGSIA